MCLKKFYSETMKKYKWYDIGFIKLGSMAFALMIAKFWEPLISLEWYWYGLILLLASIMPLYHAFKK